MEHATMFDPDDSMFQAISEIALGFPGAEMKVSHGRPAFFTKKIFAYFSGSMKVDGEYVQHEHSVMVLPDADEREALASDPRIWVPAYLGPYGWLGFDLDGPDDLAEAQELIDASYRLTAPKRLVAELDT